MSDGSALLVYAGNPHWHRRPAGSVSSWAAFFDSEREAMVYARRCKELRPDAAVFIVEQAMVLAHEYTNVVCCELDCVGETWKLVNTPMCEDHSGVELRRGRSPLFGMRRPA